jgi:flavin-dependent dehydrogenase
MEKQKTGEDYWTVRSRTSNALREWKGKTLCAADGANSFIARQFAGKLDPSEMEVAFGYRAPLPREESSSPTVVAFLPGWSGYAWAFPRLDHISFGVATSQDSFDHASLDLMLWKFMVAYYRDLTHAQESGEKQNLLWNLDGSQAKTAEIEAKLRSTAERYAARIPGLSPKTWDARKVAGKNWALLGDAAGFADPVTGEGIYYALRSAELFAEAYLRSDVASYEESWRADFGGELRRAAEMRRKFYGDFLGAPFTERMIQFAGAHRGIRRTLGELIAGEQGYMNLKSTLARSLFIY